MFKELLMRKLIQSKLGNLPKEEQDRIVNLVTKNPELFQKIAMEIKAQMDSGKDQNSATLSVMTKYKDQVEKLMKESA